MFNTTKAEPPDEHEAVFEFQLEEQLRIVHEMRIRRAGWVGQHPHYLRVLAGDLTPSEMTEHLGSCSHCRSLRISANLPMVSPSPFSGTRRQTYHWWWSNHLWGVVAATTILLFIRQQFKEASDDWAPALI